MKSQLASKPLLQSPNFEKEFIVQTDASGRGLGAVLSQMGPDGQEHPVRFLSRKLLPREQKYAAVELECLAIVWAVQALQVYVDGRKFVVETDHRALSYMQQMVNKNNRLTRWALALQPYQFETRFRSGKANGNADALSRLPVD